MSALRLIYLGLAIWGALHPMRLVIGWFRVNGFDPGALVGAWFANAATTGLAWDLVISGLTLCVWIVAETSVRKNWLALLAIPATGLIGVSCGLPLYLFLRSAPIR